MKSPMTSTLITALALSTLVSMQLLAAEAITSESRADARRIAVTSCATCHGVQGRSTAPKFPRLAGQHAEYLAAQMKNFKAHTRGDPDALGYMWGMAAPLDDNTIAALAAYYSEQRPSPGEAENGVAISRGRDIYANGIATEGIPPCAACHGAEARGTDQFPRLAGQSRQYLLKQLDSFQSNLRNVAVMHGVASGLKTGEMTDVAAYLQSLGP